MLRTARVASSRSDMRSMQVRCRPPELLSPIYVLPPPKVLAAKSYHCLLGKRPPQQCSQLPKDALIDAKLCTAEPECVQEDRTLTSDHGLPSPQVRISPLMYSPCQSRVQQQTPRDPNVSWTRSPSAGRSKAQPTENRFKELERAHCIQSGPSKGNNGVFRWESVCSFTFLIREVPCSNVRPKYLGHIPTKEAFLGHCVSRT